MKISLVFLAVLAAVPLPPAGAAPSEKRLALVIGNASYKAKALATPVNDAALIAQTLQAAGFEVTASRDLDKDLLRQAFHDFIDSVAKAGPAAVAAVYFSGYALQLDGENYLVPIDADITNAADVPHRALPLSELRHGFAALRLKAAFLILDAARASPFLLSGQRPAGGFAWVEPENNMLIALNAAPGTIAPDVAEGYGPYARALVEMIREGGLTSAEVFDRVRLRVNELTNGAQVPWDVSKIETKFIFFERGPGAPPRADSPERTAWMRSQPMRSLGAHDAYMMALMRDTFDGYTDFLADYWHDPMTTRVLALLAARREAVTWQRTCRADIPDAYWSYLERYSRGPHVADARRLLTHLGATIEPPSGFTKIEYDVPPPLPDEQEYIERTVLAFDDPAFAFEPLQPSPAYFLEPPPPELLALVPPAVLPGAAILPSPKSLPLPAYVEIPADVLVPPNSLILHNAPKTPAIKMVNDVPTGPNGQAVSSSVLRPNADNLAHGPRLSPSVETRAPLIDSQRLSPIVNPAPREEITAPQNAPVPAISSMPLWATYDLSALEELKVPQRAPVSAISSMPLWATYNLAALEEIKLPPGSRSSTAPLIPISPTDSRIPAYPGTEPPALAIDSGAPVPARHRQMLVSPPTGAPPRTSRAATLPPRTTGSIPLPIARPLKLVTPTRRQPKPIDHAASVSSPTELDQRRQSPAPLVNRLTPSPHLGRPPEVAPAASPPKHRKKLCPVVNGTPSCS